MTNHNRQLPVRKPLRLRDYDYNTPGAYFVTFCTYNRKNTLSRIVGAIHESPEPQLTGYGKIVDHVIHNIPPHLQIAIDRYVIMPNHVHLIVMIHETDAIRAIHESPLRGRSIISKAVGYIKMNVSKSIHLLYGNVPVWQRGFHEHVIRNQQDYDMISKYIHENPIRWELDKHFSQE